MSGQLTDSYCFVVKDLLHADQPVRPLPERTAVDQAVRAQCKSHYPKAPSRTEESGWLMMNVRGELVLANRLPVHRQRVRHDCVLSLSWWDGSVPSRVKLGGDGC